MYSNEAIIALATLLKGEAEYNMKDVTRWVAEDNMQDFIDVEHIYGYYRGQVAAYQRMINIIKQEMNRGRRNEK